MNRTIYAFSTPLGGGVAILRMSGPDCLPTLRRIFSRRGDYESHKLYHGLVSDGEGPVDDALAVYMPGPRSYTGEDTAELHLHGSPAVAKRVLALLSSLGLVPAEPGEFTRRAFENGKLDLSQAEAVMDLVSASAEAGAKAALSQLRGSLAQSVAALQDVLTDAIARAEAGIDYPEEDWEGEIAAELLPSLEDIAQSLRRLIESGAQGRLLRDGLRIALIGRPNVGKSSLLNALLGEQRAIVTPLPGTTRDLIEETMDWNGLPVRLMDTAGLREGADEVERIGVERARTAMREADLLLVVFDGAQPLTGEDERILSEIGGLPALAVIAKGDLPQVLSPEEVAGRTGLTAVTVSSFDPRGLDSLKAAVGDYFAALAPREQPNALLTNRRHIDAMKKAESAIVSACASLSACDLDCATIDLRAAWRALGEITGQTVDEAIVDRIFSRFCLGK